MGRKNLKEFMKIRTELFCQMSRLETPRVTLPVLRKLAEEFDVTAPTVMRAVHSLLEDGFLSIRKEGGYKSLLSEKNQDKVHIFGIVNGHGNTSFDIRLYWDLNFAIVKNLLSRSNHFCTRTIYLDKAVDLHRLVYENGLSGIIYTGASEKILHEAWKLKENIDLPGVAFYSCTRKLSSSGPKRETFQKIFDYMIREKRQHILVILQKYNVFYEEIKEMINLNKYLLDIELREEYEEDILSVLKKEFQQGKQFDGVIFFNALERVYKFICSKQDVQEKCRLVIDQFSVTRDMEFTGYEFRFNLEAAAEELVTNLLEQRIHSDKNIFVPMELHMEFIKVKGESII